MPNGAFLCPIYDGAKGDFRYGANLLESAKRFGLDENLYFVFSNHDEAEKFSNLYHRGGGIT